MAHPTARKLTFPRAASMGAATRRILPSVGRTAECVKGRRGALILAIEP